LLILSTLISIRQGGGTYGDKATTLDRIKKTITQALPENVRNRLVLENDEVCITIYSQILVSPYLNVQSCYNAEDLLPLCEELDVPFVFGECDIASHDLFTSDYSP
jgi:UV DNA damage endonuclease